MREKKLFTILVQYLVVNIPSCCDSTAGPADPTGHALCWGSGRSAEVASRWTRVLSAIKPIGDVLE